MDYKNKMLLQHHQQDIVKDLDVVYILDELFTKKVISNDDFDHIYDMPSRADRTRYLLDRIIQTGDNTAYEVFVDTLAKDYRWLWEKLAIENINTPMLNDSFEDSLSRGDVPRLPEHYVVRLVVEQNVTEKLIALTRHKILVLHGMPGSGKTAVAISVLRDNPELITSNFNGVVFWLNLGNCKTEDDIVAQQNKLYRKASSIYTHNSYNMNSSISMSSIGSNVDSQSLSSYDWTWQELRDKLKCQFAEPALKEALLVLDEVNEKKIVESFDIGCKILITTRDTDVVANFNPQIIKVENNLEERESLLLLASCLDINVLQLPRQAKKLHEICKGNPFNMALIGAQLAENKERLLHDTSHWNYYLKKLEKKDFFLSSRHNDNPWKPIEVCINSLKPNILALFKMLAVLPDNAQVSTKVLSKLWNKQVSEVEIIMKQLRSKTLIIEIYDHDQRNYIYEVHDLIMNYLRKCLTDEELKILHSEFLKSYHYDNVDNCPVDIVDDGYIAFYIGYHILHTKNLNNKWSLFNKLFLNLKFLGNKVRLSGPADVIMDMQKYENYIAQDELDKDLLCNIRAYLSTHGIDLYRYPYTNIVQSILQHESKGILYAKAYDIAQENCNKNELYFEFLHEQNVEEIRHSTIDVKEIITSVSFLGDYVLVGTTAGVIKVFHISTNKLKKELPGTGSPIVWVGACPIKPRIIASLDLSGVIKIWYMDDVDTDNSDDVIDEECEESYNNNFVNNNTIQPKLGAYINCRWANNDELLITHTSKMIILYNPDGKVKAIVDNFDRDCEILCCVLCNNDNHVIATVKYNNSYSIEIVKLRTKEKIMSLEETEPVMNILTVPGSNRIIVLKRKLVIEHEFKRSTSYQSNCNVCRCKTVINSDDVRENLTFSSIAVNKGGTLLFVSTDDSRVICIDLKTNSHVFNLENRRGNVVSMAVSEVWYDFVPSSDVLLTGTGTIENSAKVWYLDASYISQATKSGKVRLTTKFDVSFLNTLLPQTPNSSNPNSGTPSTSNTPKRHQSFVNYTEVEKKTAKKTKSLDRHAIKPLNLKGICSGNNDGCLQPLLAVVDDKNNIQIMRGRKILMEIQEKSDESITKIKISPCNQYIFYGLRSGSVKRYALRSKECKIIMDVYSPVQYMNFVNPNLLMVAGKNRCLMVYRFTDSEDWKPEMLQRGKCHLGSQEILNDIQGIKKKNTPSDRLSSSGSETSLNSRDRYFSSTERGRFSEGNLIDCFWINDIGLITVENNATIKLWDQNLKLTSVLNGRQADVYINCAAFKKNILVICDNLNMRFQTFELKESEHVSLQTIQQYKLNNKITSCDLTSDGFILAMGLDSGEVVVWNVCSKRQLYLLKHHKTRVQFCSFSPVPDRFFRNNTVSPSSHPANIPSLNEGADVEQPPLVLVTMSSEIIWWNITYMAKMRGNKRMSWKTGWNVVTPLASPLLENRSELHAQMNDLVLDSRPNFFFGSASVSPEECWKAIWKRKTYKEGSKKKEILSCIKLAGMNAKKLCHDPKFSCFVTVDNPGNIHIMNVMQPRHS